MCLKQVNFLQQLFLLIAFLINTVLLAPPKGAKINPDLQRTASGLFICPERKCLATYKKQKKICMIIYA